MPPVENEPSMHAVVLLCALIRVVSAATDVTLVTQGTSDKVWMVEALCTRWRGPLSLALWLGKNESVPQIAASKCDSFALTVVHRGSERDYPVNYLRNLAVARANTSHRLVADLDFLPSIGLRLYLRSLRDSWLGREDAALVVPAFQRHGGKCKSLAACRKRVEPLEETVPSTQDALTDCLAAKRCQTFQHDNSPGSHSTTNLGRWLQQTEPREIKCFRTNRYEPYVVVPAATSPPYDERFTGYGKNKIQHVTHLRKLGFLFVVLPFHFLIHVPHPRSRDKKRWSSDYDRHKYIDELYDKFTTELDVQSHRPFHRPPVGLCGSRQRREEERPREEEDSQRRSLP